MTRRAPQTKTREVSGAPAERQLTGFIDKYPPDLARQTRAARRKMRTRLPGAVELVYDNYNGLVIGFGPNERPSDAVFSLLVSHRPGKTVQAHSFDV